MFAGIGGFRRGLELAGHKCVGFCESDKFALASYTSMHLLTEAQREALSALPFKERQNEIRKEVYRNGEWCAEDIRTVHGWTVPKADLWCFGAPCQDFSWIGARAGLAGNRSSLVQEVFRILGEMEEADRPEWLLYENVKGMLSSRSGLDYLSILLEMERLGYDVEWQIINSKDWAVPQNRERVYTLGHYRAHGGPAVFPLTPADGENCSGIAQMAHLDGSIDNPNAYRVYAACGLAPCLTGKSGGGTEPSLMLPMTVPKNEKPDICIVGLIGGSRAAYGFGEDENRVLSITGIAPTVKAHANRDPAKIAVPIGCIDPQGRAGHSVTPSEQVPTLRAQSHGNQPEIVLSVLNPEKESTERPGIYIQLTDELIVYAIWYERYQCYVAIRKLTPKECFRLQGWTDDYFERAAFVNSNSQLYKQAGNGVTVSVVYAIGYALSEAED